MTFLKTVHKHSGAGIMALQNAFRHTFDPKGFGTPDTSTALSKTGRGVDLNPN
jgi:hypothetical protein